MSKIFGGVFGRVERSIPGTSPTIVIDGEAYDIGYLKYCIEKDRNRQISRRMDTHGIIVVERFATFHYY